MVSIIIPVYKEPYLNKTLRSLLGGAEDIEIIPVVDCCPLAEPMKIKEDFAIVLYGKNPKCSELKWNAGSFFFNQNSKEYFKKIEEVMWKFNIDEENALTLMMAGGFKCKELDYSYCVHIYNTKVKTPKALHFHPYKHLDKFSHLLPKELYEKFVDTYKS